MSDVAEIAGVSVSTLSRLESGKRRPTLELLIPLGQAYGVPLDTLVGAPPSGDPRLHLRPRGHKGRTIVPLTDYPGPLQAYKQLFSGEPQDGERTTHEGFEWLYVLKGRLRLLLGDRELVLGPGESAEFDTAVPHWLGSADGGPVEILNLFGPQGQRPRPTLTSGEGRGHAAG